MMLAALFQPPKPLVVHMVAYKFFSVLIATSTYGRGLCSRALFKQDETRRAWRTIPKLSGPGQDYFFLAPLLGKIQEKSGI